MFSKTLVLFGVLLFLVSMFTGCYSLVNTTSEEDKFAETMNAWKGHHISSAILKIGPPDNVVSDEAGGKIYVWIEHKQMSIPQYSYESVPQDNPVYVPPVTQQQRTSTQGEMRWNPYLEKWEWKSKSTTQTQNTPNSLLGALLKADAATPQKQLVTKYATRTRSYYFMFYVRPWWYNLSLESY